MKYDLIIVSQSIGDLIQMTEQCIATARQDGADLNIIVIETGEPYRYDVDKIIEYNGEFNYNRALNIGLNHVKGDVHILANNDLVFHPGWSQIGELMQLNSYHSASALHGSYKIEPGDYVIDGYEVGKTFTGWCLFMDRYCHEKIGKLDESVSFWYSDNLYAHQLESAGILHGMFCNVRVDHITSQTLIRQPRIIQRKLQVGELGKYTYRKKYYVSRKAI